ncbi:Glutathione S-transferase C-terminal domain-containing protein-like [Symbiodinium microadriaticum]|uniref:Glutathione S-transferase C-terminal domain-containing protein-like n=1 Tax=Symbiodinium microadriaticum TaxID=2951 RepID=A0A1Q9F6Q8_SYMMI|nr:Glutathione S-transferase C-terminal domain-containing protein-like [Symbiodinium microadriaticum]
MEAPKGNPKEASTAEALDPADGELDVGRAARKRAQVECLASYALQMMEPTTKVVEFGAGSGHLGLLLASQRSDCQVVLVEAKEYSADVAARRIEGTGISNCRVFHGTVDAFAATGEEFDLAVGLHLCGLLTDAVLGLARRRFAEACVVPCCYGQVATLKEDHRRGEGTAQRMHPCSKAMRMIPREAFAWCAKAADFTAGKGGAFDPKSDGFRTALKCMRIVDTDRLWTAREEGFEGMLGTLQQGCSPKCSVICVRRIPKREEADEVDAACDKQGA